MRKLIFVLMVILLAGAVFAQGVPDIEVFTQESFLEEIQENYNAQRGNAPEFFLNVFGNEKMNIYLGDIPVHAVMVDGEMTDVGTGELDDSTMNVYTDEETVTALMKEELSLKEALNDGLITYEGVGFGSKVKFGFVKAVYTVYSWFS